MHSDSSLISQNQHHSDLGVQSVPSSVAFPASSVEGSAFAELSIHLVVYSKAFHILQSKPASFPETHLCLVFQSSTFEVGAWLPWSRMLILESLMRMKKQLLGLECFCSCDKGKYGAQEPLDLAVWVDWQSDGIVGWSSSIHFHRYSKVLPAIYRSSPIVHTHEFTASNHSRD